IDGVMNGPTRAALRAYQEAARLPATGAADAVTTNQLGVSSPQTASATFGVPFSTPFQPFPLTTTTTSPLFIQPESAHRLGAKCAKGSHLPAPRSRARSTPWAPVGAAGAGRAGGWGNPNALRGRGNSARVRAVTGSAPRLPHRSMSVDPPPGADNS